MHQTKGEVKVAELKDHLSAYLREVRNGGEIVVFDRLHPIAKLVPFQEEREEKIVVIPAKDKLSDLDHLKPIRTKKKFDGLKTLFEMREDRF